jgi:hypothetical protein
MRMTQKIANRYLVGRRIVAVEVVEINAESTNGGIGPASHVERITLDDGSSITFSTVELICDYACEAQRHPR